MLEDLKNDHHGFPVFLEYEYWEEHKYEIGMEYEQWMSWSADENKNNLKAEADKICDQKWNETLDRMIFLLSEMNDDTCTMKNPYVDEWWSYHERFDEKYPRAAEQLKTAEELAEERKNDYSISVGPERDPEFGKEYEEISDRMLEYSRKIDKYQDECKDEFMELFGKYFWNLWD